MKNLFGTISKYSVIIYPPQDIIEIVAVLKNQLANRIGWYESKNSAAHISIISFNTDEYGIENLKKFLKKFANSQSPFPVIFNNTGSFGKAFILAPDEISNTKLVSLIKHFHLTRPKFPGKSFYKPHISIGRNLNKEEIQWASGIIHSVDLKFECDNISLRKYNFVKRQFEIEEKFIFNA